MSDTSSPTKIVLGIVRNSHNQVLIIQRAKIETSSDQSILTWAFPGGQIETGELPQQAIIREIFEETGYQVEADSVISERPHPQFPVYVYYFACKLTSPDPLSLSHDPEITQYQWVPPKELTHYFTTQLDPQVAEYLK